MLDFEVQRCSRRCSTTEKELQPDETFYSVLLPQNADVVRHDYCEDAWEGPPDDAIGWWKSQMPPVGGNKIHWAPNDVMLHYFQQLDGQTEKEDVRYVLGLLMVRRRVFKLEESETDDQGRELLVLHCGRNGQEYKTSVVDPSADRITEIQNELAALLFGNTA
jgi:hypothetical protein